MFNSNATIGCHRMNQNTYAEWFRTLADEDIYPFTNLDFLTGECIAQSVAELERILRHMRSRALTSIAPQSKKEQDAEVCLQSDLEKLKENLLDLDIFIDDLKDVNITKEGDYLLEIIGKNQTEYV